MVDRWVLRQVDRSNLVSTEEHPVVSVIAARPNGETLAKERLAHRPQSSLEADVGPRTADLPHDLARLVFRLRQRLRHRSRARAIAARRHRVAQRLMRSVHIVNVAPAIERSLFVSQ